jgi:hypothetical protein
MSTEKDRPLSTADLAAASDRQRSEARSTPPRPEAAAERAERSEHAAMRNEPRREVRPEPPMNRGADMGTAEQAVSSAEAAHAPRAEPARTPQPESPHAAATAEEKLEALFAPDAAQGFRTRWDEVQIGFVDDPKKAVRQADELVAQVMQSLAQTFAHERTRLEAQLNDTNRESTENLRVALRRYRSFFQRLLSL